MKNIFRKVSIILVALLAIGTMSYATITPTTTSIDSTVPSMRQGGTTTSSSITTAPQTSTQSSIVQQPAGQTSTSSSTTVLSESKQNAEKEEKEKEKLPHAGASSTAFYAIAILSVVAGVMYTKARN